MAQINQMSAVLTPVLDERDSREIIEGIRRWIRKPVC